MSSPFEQLREVDPACLVANCEKHGCAVYLDGAPCPFHLIDLDHPRSPAGKKTKCDYLFLGNGDKGVDVIVVPIELKSSGIRSAKVLAQLRGGAKIAEDLTGRVPARFIPVAASGEKPHRRVYDEMAKSPVSFRGRPHVVRVIQCGDHLADALQQAA